eukprot:COSAG06_NODE_4172_length_4501_cov_3.927079_2_plen_79_part_00
MRTELLPAPQQDTAQHRSPVSPLVPAPKFLFSLFSTMHTSSSLLYTHRCVDRLRLVSRLMLAWRGRMASREAFWTVDT